MAARVRKTELGYKPPEKPTCPTDKEADGSLPWAVNNHQCKICGEGSKWRRIGYDTDLAVWQCNQCGAERMLPMSKDKKEISRG